jgi:putative NADH-flavin reductase
MSMPKPVLQLVIFGAKGPTGQILTREALSRGYIVTAVTRRPEQFGRSHDNLRVRYGDVYETASVVDSIRNQDAVVSVVGSPFSLRPLTIYSQCATAIVAGMQGAGVRRLLFTSAGGTNPHSDPTEGFIFGRLIKPTIGRSTYRDLREAEAIVMQTDLDWTIVRPARLVNRPTTGAYQCEEGYMVPGKTHTARASLAGFLLDEIADGRYHRKGVAVASDI